MPDRTASDLARFIRDRAGDTPVEIALVLGSGLGGLADDVDGIAIGYDQLTGFPGTGVSGHRADLVVGRLEGRQVAVLGGRSHYYERGDAAAMRLPLEVVKALGATRILLTNAAGSLDPGMPTGSAMMLNDHINFSGLNPLIGEATDARFVPMTDAYAPGLRTTLAAAAERAGQTLFEGIYAWYSGPSFETPAEIRAIRTLGADAVGMSTVPEVILSRFLGLEVAAISAITNMAAGMSDEVIGHEHTKEMAPIAAAKIARILKAALPDL